jgi:nucleoid-associated protein YgaU
MSAVLAQPAWQPAPAPRPARRATGGRPVRRGNLQLVGPGFVPPAAAPARDARAEEAARAAAPPAALRLTVRGRRVVAVLALVAATAVSVGAGALVGMAANPAADGATTTVTVGAGETLWSLASAAASPGEDPREVVEQITALNGLASSDLAVGQELILPAE